MFPVLSFFSLRGKIMALNAAQIARRVGKLGSSDMGRLMSGDAAKIDRLWREKTGQELPEDLSDVWPVQLGTVTEPLNLNWYERRQRQAISRRGDVVEHYAYDWACCTLDGWIDEMQCPIECKHVGGREPWEVIEERYQPQMQWQMEVTGASQCALSVIMGTSEPVVEFIKRDVAYATELIDRGKLFIEHVRNNTPPVDMPAVPAPIDAKAVYDMTGKNEWAANARTWLDLRLSAEMCADAAKVLKALVPPDAKKCHGHDIQITRDRAGRLSLRELQE